MKLNLPNKLTVLRLILVPVILVFTILPYSIWANLLAFAVFGIASLTDMLDGTATRMYMSSRSVLMRAQPLLQMLLPRNWHRQVISVILSR